MFYNSACTTTRSSPKVRDDCVGRESRPIALISALSATSSCFVQILNKRYVAFAIKVALARKFFKKFTDEVVTGYLAEPEPSRFGVINAFTRAAQGLAPLQRIEMERFSGTLLEAPL